MKWKCKIEWERQLNTYAAMFRSLGYPVENGRIVAMLKDWKSMEARRRPTDYPPVPVVTVDAPMWDNEEAMAYIRSRLNLIEGHRDTPDNDLPDCTDEELWRTEDKWAVKKVGGKRANRVLDSEEDALDWMQEQKNPKGYHIQFRKGRAKRCRLYCPAKMFCNQYARMVAEGEVE